MVPARCLRMRASRAGGPGGQNVNKVETKVELLLDLDAAAASLGADAVARIRAKLDARLDAEGRLRVASSAARTRERNLALAHERMAALLVGALRERRKRHLTKPTKGSRERRISEKKARGARKQLRGKPNDD